MESNLSNQKWFLLGDIHGRVEPIQQFYERNYERLHLDETENFLILLGDVGANFALVGQRDRNFKTELSKYPFTYLCLRGNHEARVSGVMEQNPECWERKKKYDGEVFVEREFPKIEYLSDAPAVYTFGGVRTFSIPGAYSVDKWYRLSHGWPWFEDEQLTEEEMELGRRLVEAEKSFELVISHTCPLMFEPTDLFLKGLDQSQVDQTMERYLNELEYKLSYHRWVWGHFHADRLYPFYNGRQMLMLFNENVVDLKKLMEMTGTESFRDIIA